MPSSATDHSAVTGRNEDLQLVASSLALGSNAIGRVCQAESAPANFTPYLRICHEKTRGIDDAALTSSSCCRDALDDGAQAKLNGRAHSPVALRACNAGKCLLLFVEAFLRTGDGFKEEYCSPPPVAHLGESGLASSSTGHRCFKSPDNITGRLARAPRRTTID
jgi:hypothetical protein